MKLDSTTLTLFSPRAQKVLRGASREPAPTRSAIIRRLERAGRPVFDAVIDFEQRFSGLHFRLGLPGHEQEFKLGIEWHAPRPAPDDPDHPERTMVPIGSGWNGYAYLYMNEQGEVVSHFDAVLMKSSSVVRYLEQEVIGLIPRWKAPSFRVDLRPALGERLATVLNLRLIDEVSDQYEAWWRGRGLFVQQIFFRASWKAKQTSVYARSIADLVRALEAASALEADLAADVGSNPFEEKRLTKKQRARAPTLESWASTPRARRYRFGTEAAHMTGAVWVIEERGALTIQQYRVYADEDGEELLAWDTFTPSGGISRDMED